MPFCWFGSLFSAPELASGHRDFCFSFFPMPFCWFGDLLSAPGMALGHRDFRFFFFPMPFGGFDDLFSATGMALRHRDFNILKIPMPLTFLIAFLNEYYGISGFNYDYYIPFITPQEMHKLNLFKNSLFLCFSINTMQKMKS